MKGENPKKISEQRGALDACGYFFLRAKARNFYKIFTFGENCEIFCARTLDKPLNFVYDNKAVAKTGA